MVNILRIHPALCLIALLAVPSVAEAESVISQLHGPHAVGFRVVQQYDRTREFKPEMDPATGQKTVGERARPIQTLIWYPAASKGKNLRYVDYVHTRYSEANFALTATQRDEALAKTEANWTRRLGEGAKQLMTSEREIGRDVPFAKGKFPVVIYAAGAGGVADENADLCEYLASHGYLVLASTSMAARDKDIGDTMESAEPQIADILYLVNYAEKLGSADIQRVGTIGWSWGGMTNLFAASRDDRFDAVVSLDGTREPALTRQIDIHRLNTPWLYVSRSPDTIPQINKSEIDTTFSLLNEARHADVYQLIMYPMQHVDFVSRRLHESSAASYGEYSRDEIVQAYGMMALYVRQFLDAKLKQSAEAQRFLEKSPRENGAVPHSIRLEFSPAEKKTP